MMYDDSCLIGMFNLVEKRAKVWSTKFTGKCPENLRGNGHVRCLNAYYSCVLEKKSFEM